MVNGVLFEKTKGEVIPELNLTIANLDNVSKKLSDALVLKKQEIARLEQEYIIAVLIDLDMNC